jgi:hypothetical protein
MKAQKIIVKINHDGKIGSKVNMLLDSDPKMNIQHFNAVKGDNLYTYEALMKIINSLSIPLEKQNKEYKAQTATLELYHDGVMGSEVEFNFFTTPKINPHGTDPEANLYIILLLKRMFDVAEEYEAIQIKLNEKRKDKDGN